MLYRITIYMLGADISSEWKKFNAEAFATECTAYAENVVMFTAEFKSE